MLISSNETKLIKESEADEEQREKKERKIRREKKKKWKECSRLANDLKAVQL